MKNTARNLPAKMLCRAQQRMSVLTRAPLPPHGSQRALARLLHSDHRSRLSRILIPQGSLTDHDRPENEESHSKLMRAGIVRQAHSGIFHLLPLGLRVQSKLEKLIDRHMEAIGASRLSLSTFSSPAVWRKSGRYQKAGAELFHVVDRKNSRLLLSPTHEEEITSLVKQTTSSHKNLPLRLYQITRKYRDELRPRQGLLRAREFVMKDLYTFDLSLGEALATYNLVRSAYDKIFAGLGLEVRVAEASSGDIGGDLSHEYHLPSTVGEDVVISCSSCGYVANAEVAETRLGHIEEAGKPSVWRGISKDRATLVNVWYPESVRRDPSSAKADKFSDADVNIHAVRELVPDIDGSVEDVCLAWWDALAGSKQTVAVAPAQPAPTDLRLLNIADYRLPESFVQALELGDATLSVFPFAPASIDKIPSPPSEEVIARDADGNALNMLNIWPDEPCPKCESGKLRTEKAIELAHTFHLGTRYSEPMGLTLSVPPPGPDDADAQDRIYERVAGSKTRVSLQMGCHGIGVSRIMAAVAEHLADDKGLNWPRAIAPYEVVIVTDRSSQADGSGERIYDLLADSVRPKAAVVAETLSPSAPGEALDLLIDDRQKSVPWKLKDADLVGYPVIVVLGRDWSGSGRCEVQCRRLGTHELVLPDELPPLIHRLLEQL